MRTANDIFEDLVARGRTSEQIRIVALARGERELLKLAEDAMAKRKTEQETDVEVVPFEIGTRSRCTAQVKLAYDPASGLWRWAADSNIGTSGVCDPLCDNSPTAATREEALREGLLSIRKHAEGVDDTNCPAKKRQAALKAIDRHIHEIELYIGSPDPEEKPEREGGAPVAGDAGRIDQLPVAAVYPSPENRRLSDDDPTLQPLCESMRAEGLIQPIVVRTGSGPATWEIVCGERRWRAARKLGWERIPAIVRDGLSDGEAHILRLTENLQRSDVPPLEQSVGVAAALERYGDAREVAKLLGVSEGWVYLRARLRNLSETWRSELADPETPYARFALHVGYQEELAKLPPATQDLLWEKRALIACATEEQLAARIGEWLRRLSDAPWPAEAEKALPRAERCAQCQRRTDREPTLFPDLARKDGPGAACLDPACWDRKVDLWLRGLVRQARAEHPGLVVLSQDYYCEFPATLEEAIAGLRVVMRGHWTDHEGVKGLQEMRGVKYEKAVGIFLAGNRRGEIAEVYVRQQDEEEDSDEGLETRDSGEVERARKEREANEEYVARVAERVSEMGYDDLPSHDQGLILLRLCAIYGSEPSGERERIDGLPANQVAYDVWIGVRSNLQESLCCAECRDDAEYVARMLKINVE